MKLFFILFLISLSFPAFAQSKPISRFDYEGDGTLSLQSKYTKRTHKITYRLPDGTYPPKAIKELNAAFGVSSLLGEDYSLRTVSALDYLEDLFSPDMPLKILSGYRSPTYNEALRKKGKLAGKTSYHIEGMAADIEFPQTKAKRIWDFVKNLNVFGIGYYGGQEVHFDSGRPRFWTSETAIPKAIGPQENKNVYLSAEFDRYRPGEKVRLFFSGLSNYPFGVMPQWQLIRNGKNQIITPGFTSPTAGTCHLFEERHPSRFISWQIPEDFPKSEKPVVLEVTFCGRAYPGMPLHIQSRPFRIE